MSRTVSAHQILGSCELWTPCRSTAQALNRKQVQFHLMIVCSDFPALRYQRNKWSHLLGADSCPCTTESQSKDQPQYPGMNRFTCRHIDRSTNRMCQRAILKSVKLLITNPDQRMTKEMRGKRNQHLTKVTTVISDAKPLFLGTKTALIWYRDLVIARMKICDPMIYWSNLVI